jgi:hypothetical protein
MVAITGIQQWHCDLDEVVRVLMIQYFAFQPVGFGVSGLADSSVEKVILITDQDTPLLQTPGSLRVTSPAKRDEFSGGT